MLTKIHGKHCFECDNCGDTLESDTDDFPDALRIMRSQNWQAKKIGQDWVHTCFGCTETEARNERARKAGRIP